MGAENSAVSFSGSVTLPLESLMSCFEKLLLGFHILRFKFLGFDLLGSKGLGGSPPSSNEMKLNKNIFILKKFATFRQVKTNVHKLNFI